MTTATADRPGIPVRTGGRPLGDRLGVRHPRLVIAALLAGLTARIVFWAVTDRRFEDGLITVTHAVSLFDGIGLTHHPGEPVTHGFTTALSVGVPIIGEGIGQIVPGVDGFLALRLASLVAFAFTVVFAARIGDDLGLGRFALGFALAYLALDQNQIFYGMAGMETQMAVAILLASIHYVMRGRTTAAGVTFGLAILVRPDFALWVGAAGLYLLLRDRRSGLRSLGIGAAIVLPWVLFTAIYYGSPVPNTISAKSLRYPVDLPGFGEGPIAWIEFLKSSVLDRHLFWHQFTPFLENGLIVDAPLPEFASAAIATVFILLAAVGAAVTRGRTGWWPALLFIGVFLVYRFIALPEGYYEWYYGPLMALLALCAAAGIQRVRDVGPKTGAVAAVTLAVLFAWHLPYSIRLENQVQSGIEDRVRKPMAEWLRRNVEPGQTVTSESAGYVGYYGRVKLYDYPGLTSKETYATMKRLGSERNSLQQLVNAALPDWLVLRPNEAQAVAAEFPDAWARYRPVKQFSVPGDQTPLSWRGTTYVNIDRDFTVYRRVG